MRDRAPIDTIVTRARVELPLLTRLRMLFRMTEVMVVQVMDIVPWEDDRPGLCGRVRDVAILEVKRPKAPPPNPIVATAVARSE